MRVTMLHTAAPGCAHLSTAAAAVPQVPAAAASCYEEVASLLARRSLLQLPPVHLAALSSTQEAQAAADRSTGRASNQCWRPGPRRCCCERHVSTRRGATCLRPAGEPLRQQRRVGTQQRRHAGQQSWAGAMSGFRGSAMAGWHRGTTTPLPGRRSRLPIGSAFVLRRAYTYLESTSSIQCSTGATGQLRRQWSSLCERRQQQARNHGGEAAVG